MNRRTPISPLFPYTTLFRSVTSVNDAPSGANNTVTTNEDTAYTFTAADFGFSDPNDSPANAFLAVKITTLPSGGSQSHTAVPHTLQHLVSLPVLNDSTLKLTPSAMSHGSPYTTFTFSRQE